MPAYRTVRKYPRDVTSGARILIKAATATGTRMVPGTLTELIQDGRTYRVAVETEKGDRYHWRQNANAKLTVILR